MKKSFLFILLTTLLNLHLYAQKIEQIEISQVLKMYSDTIRFKHLDDPKFSLDKKIDQKSWHYAIVFYRTNENQIMIGVSPFIMDHFLESTHFDYYFEINGITALIINRNIEEDEFRTLINDSLMLFDTTAKIRIGNNLYDSNKGVIDSSEELMVFTYDLPLKLIETEFYHYIPLTQNRRQRFVYFLDF